MSVLPSTRLGQLGLALPPLRAPVGNFVMAVRHGDLLYLSGQGPTNAAGVGYSINELLSLRKLGFNA